MTDTFDLAALTAELTQDEGRRDKPYVDTTGHTTIGIGRNISSKGLSDPEIDFLFANDVAACVGTLDHEIPWWRDLPAPQQRVMLNMCFNLGWTKLSEFRHFLAAMMDHDWPDAAGDLEDSLWFSQVGDRGPRMVARLVGGVA